MTVGGHGPEVGDEVARLLAMARDKSRHGRSVLYQAVTDLFERRGDVLTGGERQLMVDILTRLGREVEMSVRRRLAQRLAAWPNAPRELIIELANDQIDVALPILANSTVLRDADLVEVVRQRTQQHQLAVAMRAGIGESVSTALVGTGDEDVVLALLKNPDARIAAAVLEYLADESRRVDSYQEPLLHRPDLPPKVARRMAAWVSAALREHIVRHFDVDPSELDAAIVGALRETAQEETGRAPSPAERLVDKLHAAGELSQGFVVKALRQGQIGLFEAAVARLTDLRPLLLRRILYEPGGEGLAVVCRGIGFDRQVFLTVFRLTRMAGETPREPTARETGRLMAFYDSISREAADGVLRSWRLDEDYLNALRQLRQGGG